MLATRYAGLGLTAFGLIPGRPQDSFGAGIAWSTLNHNLDLRPDEILLQAYDQVQASLSANFNPQAAVARIEEAQGTAEIGAAPLFPSVSVGGTQGELNRSSQHLEGGCCDDQSKAAFGTIWAAAIVVTRSTASGRTR